MDTERELGEGGGVYPRFGNIDVRDVFLSGCMNSNPRGQMDKDLIFPPM